MTTLLAARAEYFANNGFGDDGGYEESTVTLWVFGLPVTFPNTRGRKDAVVYHDLHHIITGYGTDNLGEAEIGAWELGSGCSRYSAALVLNTLALLLGVFQSPRRVYAAFVRGRGCRNLYGTDLERTLKLSVEEVRAAAGLDVQGVGRPTDMIRFGLWLVSAVCLVAFPMALILAAAWAAWMG